MKKRSKKEIEAVKAKHGKLHMLTVEDNWAILNEPSETGLGLARVKGTQTTMGFNEIILKNCMVLGDEEIRTDDAYFLAASGQLSKIIEMKEASLEKL